jgi:hypothetical protein
MLVEGDETEAEFSLLEHAAPTSSATDKAEVAEAGKECFTQHPLCCCD